MDKKKEMLLPINWCPQCNGKIHWKVVHGELGKGSCYATAKTKIKALKLLEKDRKDFLRLPIQEKVKIPKPRLFNLD